MKKYINKGWKVIVLSTTMVLTSCTKNLPDLNNNPNAIIQLDATALNYIFSTSLYYGISAGTGDGGAYQLFTSLFTDQRAQYFYCVGQNFPSDRNVMVGNWLSGNWSQLYLGQQQINTVLKNTASGAQFENLAINAIAKVWRVYTVQLITDAYGAVPYSQQGSEKNVVLYDPQKDIYTDFLKLLNEAVSTLKDADLASGLGDADLIYGGNTKKWLKFANTLHLRVAMRMSNVEPALAQKEAEIAMNAPGGLLLNVEDNAMLKVSNNTPNPLAAISNWGEFRMSAAMQSLLQGYEDPRIEKYFAPAVNSKKFKGARNGLTKEQMQSEGNTANDNSNLALEIGFLNKGTAPYPILNAAETNFLLAEAKLKGWNVGAVAVKDYYEAGIKSSMDQWKVDAGLAASYINTNKIPVALDDEFQTPALSDIPVAFSTNPVKQLEQIITQKWLALFPMSAEAWAEYRRTGFPKLYPRINNENSDASVNPNSVHRLTYPPSEFANNRRGYDDGVKKLGGEDKVSTKVWWDVVNH